VVVVVAGVVVAVIVCDVDTSVETIGANVSEKIFLY